MSRSYLAVPAALSAAMVLIWSGCASTKQPEAAGGEGGTNLAYMAEGAPLIASAGGAAPSTTPGAMPSAAPTTPLESFAYTIQPGDSLWKIANKYGTSVSLIQKMNNMPPDKITIRVGDKLTIPGKADAERLRAQPAASTAPATGGFSTIPTATAPAASATATTPTLTVPTITVPTVTIPTAPTPMATTPTVTTPTVTPPTVTPPSTGATSGGASWLPPSYRTPQTGAATTPGASATPPSLSITPGSATLSPGAVSATPPSQPPGSLTLSPGSATAPAGGLNLQVTPPSVTPTTPTTPPPNP